MEDCIFCAIADSRARARKVFEDGDHVAFLPLRHIQPGHTLLIPRRHVDSLFEMADEDYAALWAKAKRLAPALRRVSGAARVGVLVEGFSVPHVHVHLVPVSALNDIDPARERELEASAADRLADALRAEFSRKAT